MSKMSVYSTAPVPAHRLWYGVLAAMGAWIVHGLGSFVISDAACVRAHAGVGMSVGTLQAILVALTLAMLGVAVSGALVAWTTWRALATGELEHTEAHGRGEFMAVAGIFISAIFIIGIVWGGLAPLLTGLCEATR